MGKVKKLRPHGLHGNTTPEQDAEILARVAVSTETSKNIPENTHDLINFIEDVTGQELDEHQKAMIKLGNQDPVFHNHSKRQET